MLASKLGWILTGRTTEPAEDTPEHDMLILTYSTNTLKETSLLTSDKSFPTKPNLEDFWKLESIGITDSPLDSDKDKTPKIFNDTIEFEDVQTNLAMERRQILPARKSWKTEVPSEKNEKHSSTY